MTKPQKLNTGDRVLLLRSDTYDPPKGSKGTVAKCSVHEDYRNNSFPFVVWDNWTKTGIGHEPTPNGWHVSRSDLRKVR